MNRGHRTDRADQQDPVLYRFYEALMVYGQSYKSIIHEKVRPAPPPLLIALLPHLAPIAMTAAEK